MKLPIQICCVLTIFAVFSNAAYAYLDPGTGSILFQGLIAAIATGLATGKFWWHRFKGVFVKESTAQVSTDVDDS
jgi:hypothetical protein